MNLIDSCYLYALNYLSYPATYFGLKNGNICVFGYDNSLTSGLLVSGALLADSQCYQDCNLVPINATLSYYNSSSVPKCGSNSTISIYQLSNIPKALLQMTNKTSSLALTTKVKTFSNLFNFRANTLMLDATMKS